MGRRITGKSKRLEKLESIQKKAEISSKEKKRLVKERDLIATLEANKVEEHGQLYRATTSLKLLEAWSNKGFFELENDFNFGSTKISGVSFTDDVDVAGRFFEGKEFGERDPEGFEFVDEGELAELIPEFPVMLIVRENGLMEDEPMAFEDINRDDLITHPEITDHLYNPMLGFTSVDDIGITQEFVDFMATPSFELKRTFPNASEKAIKEVGDLADGFDTFLDDSFGEDYPDKPSFKEGLENTDLVNEYLFNSEFAFDFDEQIPYLLRIRNALDLAGAEGEIITLEPTRIGFDDLNIFVESEEQKKILISKIPLLQDHILVKDVEKGLLLRSLDQFSKFE